MQETTVLPARGAGAPVEGALSWGAHLRATFGLGAPLAGAQLAQIAINVTDTLMVGRLGATELAAAVLGTQAFFVVWIFGGGFAQAAMPIAAAAEGRGDRTGVRRSIRMGFWVVALYGLLMLAPLWHFEAVLLALGQTPETARLAGAFMRILEWGLVPALLVAGARSALSVTGHTGTILLVTIGGAAANAVLNWGLIFGNLGLPALGLEGSALASAITNTLMALAMLVYCARAPRLQAYRFFQRIWRPDWPAFREVLRLGWPISTTIVAEVGLFTASTVMMGWLGAVALAAHGIALQLASIAFMIPLGLSQAATVRVGTAFGAGDWTNLRRAAWTAIAAAIASGLAGAILFWTVPDALVGFYLDPAAPSASAVLTTGVQLVAVAAAFQMIDCLQVVSSGVLRGLADTRIPMVIALVSYWAIGMPIAYGFAFGLGMGGIGIWTGLAAGLLAAAVLMTGRFALRVRLGLTPA
ncbi:putative multidrug resistance protein NorM [Aureimonas endophytica]|uniref:Multidrug-efflux transporter n=1 Tax=Aureimonas endophytica TaxID=2027858 RepID=A0A917A387_9HYPH|nr:MATE family efflux transporter [Aureimonas endophytica]GGE23589.1 putative multidrug resistance protein NorM [Aureimonas endophytica]